MKTCANRSTIKPLALAGAIALALTVSASAVAQQASAPPLVTVPPGSLQNSSISQTAGADSTLSSQDSGQMQDSSACVGPAGSCGAPPPPAGPSCPVGSIPYGAYPECEVKKDLGCTGGWVGQRIWWVDVFTGTPIALFQNTCAAPSSPPASPPPASPPPASPPPATPPPPPPPPPAAPNPPSPWLGVALPGGAYNAATILSDLCQGHAGFVVDIEPTGTITLTSVSKSAWPMTGSPYCGSPSNDAFTGQWLPTGGTASQYSVSVTEVSVSCLRANGTNCPPDIIGYSGSFVSGSTPQLMSFWTPTIGDAGGTDDAYFTLSITVRNNVTGATTTSTIQLHAMVDGSV